MQANSDASTEGDETIILEATDNYGYNTFVGYTITITLKDGARPATATDGVTVSPTSLALTELGTSSTVVKTYTVVLDTDPGVNVTVTVTNGDATAVEVDTDAGTSGNQSTLTFTAGGDGSGTGVGNGNWAVAQTVTVRARNDGDGANESFNVTHVATATGNTAPYHGIAIDPVAVTTTDAGHGVVVPASLGMVEGEQPLRYTVRLKSRPSGNVVISVTSGATATVTVSPATLTFGTGDWRTGKPVAVTARGAGTTTISHQVSTTADTANYPTTTTIASVPVTVLAQLAPRLTVSPTAIQSKSLDGARITLTPRGASFFAAGGTGSGDGQNPVTGYVNSADLDGGGNIPDTRVRLSATGLANITLSGAPSGLTISAGWLLPTRNNVHGVDHHRSVEIELAYTGTAVTESDPVTVTVDNNLLRLVDSNGGRPSDLSAEFTVTAAFANRFVVVETGGDTTVSEDGTTTTDSYTVALVSEPTHDVTVTATAESGAQVNVSGGTWGSSQTLTFTTTDWSIAQTVSVRGVDDDVDNQGGVRDPDIYHSSNSTDPGYVIARAGTVDVRVPDDDPTTVTLSGAAGDIEEGQAKTFHITLGRRLVDGEVLTVPLTFGGTATRGADYTMAGAVATGVGYANLDSGNASVTFTGLGLGATATTATITLSATSDGTAESTAETVDIGMGTITDTGLANFGGVEETDTLAAFGISDPATADGVTVSPTSLALTERGMTAADRRKTYTVVLDTNPGVDVTVTATNGDGSAVALDTDPVTSDFQSTMTFTAGGDGSGSGAGNGNWAVPQTVTVESRIDGDAANESFSITHAATAASGPYSGITVDPVAVTVSDAGHGVVVTDSSLSVAENDETDVYWVELKSAPSGNVTVTATSAATGTATVSPASVTFGTSDWDTPKEFTVTGKRAGSTTISHAVQSSADATNYPTTTTIDPVAVTVTAGLNPRLTLSPAEIPSGSLDGATITLVPKDSTFKSGGGGGGGNYSDFHPDDVGSQGLKDPDGEARLSASGLAKITLSGAPSGLTIASGKLLARETSHSHGGGTKGHRSAEITLAYSGSAVTADDTVSVTVRGGSGQGLLRWGTENDGSFPPDLSADFTVKAAAGGVTVSPTTLALTELGSSSTIEKTYTVVLDTDPGVNVTITATSGDATAVEVDTDAGTTGNQSTLTFTHGNSGNWSTAQTVTVRALNDADGAGESFNVTHVATASGNTAPYHGITIDPVAVTTTDAGHGVVVSESSLSVAENDETDTYTVVLKSAPSGSVTVSATSGATARATVSPATLTFGTSDWNTPKTFTVTGKGAGSTSISHAVQSSADTTNYPTTTTIPAVSVTVTADSRQVLDLSFNQANQTEGGDAGLTVTATGGSGSVLVAGGTALLTFSGDGIASSDYSFTAASNLVLSGGPPPSRAIAIDFASDSVDEPNETLVVGLQNLPGGFRAGTTASITIVDRNPTTVTLAGGGTVREDGANSADVTVTLSRNLVAGETVTVPLAIAGTGIAAGDYMIVRAPGSSLNRGVTLDTSNPHSAAQPAVVFTGHGTNTVQVATLRVTAVQDSTDEGASEALAVGFDSGNRAVMSNLDRASGTGTTGTTTAGTATVTITDDDTSVVPEISMELQTGETSNRNTAGQLELVESGGVDGAVFNLSADSVLASTLTVCLQVTETGGDLVAAAAEGIRTATLTSSGNANGAGIYTLTWSGDADDERNSVVTATLVAPETAGCSAANGSYTVSSAMASDAVFIEDDDATTVELTSSDTSMAEGDASETATLTFTLGRRLHAGEVLVVPFTLATSTGARLPGHSTPDFAVTAAGTGVTIARPNTATPSVTFTGHGTSTVQVATVTLTPVDSRDDGDTAREEITATLVADSVLGSTAGTDTTVGGGAMRHATDFAVDLTLEDDDAPAGANELTLTLSSASAPEGSGGTRDVTVTVAKPAGSARASYRLCFSGTATLDEDGERAPGEDYRVIKFNGGQQTVFHGGHLSLFHTTGGARCVGGGSVTFLAGVDSHAWRVRVFGDTLKESDETVVVTLSGSGTPLPDGWSISPAGNPATHVIANDDAPHVTLHAVDPVAVEGSSTDTAAIEVRLSHALEAGETLEVNLDTNTYIWGTSSLDGSPAGVAYSRPGAREHRLVFTGPSAPDRARIVLEASANSVSGDGLQSRDHYVELIDLDGYPGATLDSRQASRQFLQVVDSAAAAGHGVTLSVHSWPDGSMREIGEGGKAVLKVSTTGGRPVQVTVAVQPVTADFDDLGRASEGGYGGGPANATGWVAWQERDGHQGLDLYSVTAFEQPAPSVYMQIPVVDDGLAEGPETFRAFIYRTPPGYKAGGGLAGTRGSTVEFTIPANDGGLPLNAAAVQVPDAQVANLEVTRVDANAASARWDAVAYATGYEVAWDALDGNGQAVVSGIDLGVTGTTLTIEHQAPGAASLEVTVTPTYVDGNGDTQTLADLAATATLDLSAQSGAQADSLQAGAASCDLAEVKADVNRYILETQHGAAHVARWKKALAGLNGEAGGMTAAGARQMKAKYSPGRWQPVVDALDCLEKAAVTQPETPAAVPELSLSAGPAVDEGGSAVFTVHADPAPAAELTVAFTVAQDGEYLDAPGAGSRQVTLAAGAASATLAIATADDGADEADGSVSVTLDAGAGYAVAAGKAAAKVAVRDNDEPVVSIAAGSGVTEGDPATFTVTATPAPAAPLTVALTVGQSGDFAAAGETGAREVTVPVAGSATFEVVTTDDSKDEPDGSVTATLAAGTGYAVAASPGDAASVVVADDDAAPSAPALAVADATANEGDGFMWFTVTLSPASDRTVSVDYRTRESNPVSARANSDFLQVDFGDVTFGPGETSKRFWVYVFDDSHDEGSETFEVALSAPTGGAVIADGVGVGTIVNDDPMPAAFLSRFGRTVAEQALDGIAARIAAPRDPGVSGSFAGHVDLGSLAARGDAGTGEDSVHDAATALEEDGQGIAQAAPDGGHGIGHVPPDGHGPALAFLADGGGSGDGSAARGSLSGKAFLASGHDGFGDGTEVRSVTLEEAMLATGFTATRGTDAAGGSLAFWGRADLSGFDGREGTFSLDGEAATAMLGADYARGRWLAGLMVMQSSGEGDYADSGGGDTRCPQELDAETRRVLCGGAVREGDGDVEASLTAAVPWAAYRASERVRLWGALGRGTGEVTLVPEAGGGPLAAGLSWSMAAAGLRGDLRAPSGAFPALAVTADALATRTASDATDGLAASESNTSRLRVGIEGSWNLALGDGGRLRPRLEIGARHDGGDAETGLGIELGGGVSWTDPGLGVSLDLSGRTLVVHDDGDLADRGVSLVVIFDPDPDTDRGPTISMKQDLGGAASGGIDALFAHDPLEDRAESDGGVRRTVEAAWGLPALGGRFTGSPHAGLSTVGDARDWTLGWRLEPEGERPGTPDLTFGTRAVRREGGDGQATHSVGVEAGIRW